MNKLSKLNLKVLGFNGQVFLSDVFKCWEAAMVAEVVTAVVMVVAVIWLLTYIEEDTNTTGESFLDDFGRFRRFFQNANRHTDRQTDGQMDGQTYGHMDGHTLL